MNLSPQEAAEYVAAYRESEPLYPVEREAMETLPAAFADGEYGRRDVEWVVRWYFRRHLGSYPDDDRRAREEAFENADFETVRDAIAAAGAASSATGALEPLTDLPGVDVRVASALTMFMKPNRYLVVGAGEWDVIRKVSPLVNEYPDRVTPRDYASYLDAAVDLRDRLELSSWELYQVLRRVWKSKFDRPTE